MFKKILIALVLIVAALVVVISLRPAEFRVARTATIAAPPSVVFPHVNDLHKWQEWSPWVKRDPAAKITFEGPSAGTGAVFRWAGNSEVGEGAMTITDSRPNEMVRFKLDFLKPFEGTSDAEFNLTPEGDKTVVMWSMTGKNNFIAKAISLVMDCDKMIGGDFEKGLANLNDVVSRK